MSTTDACDTSDINDATMTIGSRITEDQREAQKIVEERTGREAANWERQSDLADFFAHQDEYFDKFRLVPVSAPPIHDCYAVLLTDVGHSAVPPRLTTTSPRSQKLQTILILQTTL
jgi:hypothetical protein